MADSTLTANRAEPMPASLRATLIFGAPLLVLALGHTLSNMLRTLPAIAADVISADISVSPETLATFTGAYHLAFAAGQIPVGVALDRYGVRGVSLALFAIVTAGAVLAASVGGATGFLIAQIVLGIGCSGMMLCPITLAAKLLKPAQFGLWFGLIQSVGNAGMLLSASPMAWLIEQQGWRAGFWISAVFAVLLAVLISFLVSNEPPQRTGAQTTLRAEAREVFEIGFSRQLIGIIILGLASYSTVLTIRGMWGGPWLMELKGLGRVEAGNALLPLTLALVIGPIVYGILDRRLGHRRLLLIAGHLTAASALLFIATGGPGGVLSEALGVAFLPVQADVWAFLVFGAAIAAQPLLFAMARVAVSPDKAGKALAAVNLSYFAGAAIMQVMTTPVAAAWGMPAVMAFIGMLICTATAAFVLLTRVRPG